MEQIIGRIEAKTRPDNKEPGIKINGKWFNIDSHEGFNIGDMVSIVLDGKDIKKIEKLDLEENQKSIEKEQVKKEEEKAYHFNKQQDFIDFKKEELLFRQYQQQEILKQVCLKEAVNLTRELITNNYFESLEKLTDMNENSFQENLDNDLTLIESAVERFYKKFFELLSEGEKNA